MVTLSSYNPLVVRYFDPFRVPAVANTPITPVAELGNQVLAYDGCMSFFAGPSDKEFSAKVNLYDCHYNATHIMGTTGGNNDDLIEANELAAKGIIDPAIMVYGEPWAGGTSKLKSGTSETKLTGQMTVQESLAQDYFSGSGVMVGAFNDVIRNAIRGDNGPGKGYVQGISSDASMIAMCAEGVFSKGTIKTQNIDPNLVLNYASCHDNYTLYDQLVQTMNEDRIKAAYTQADAIVFLTQGVPFIQEGEEFMRSKLDPETGKYSGNSYNVGDFINVMDYSLKIDHKDVFEKTKELIAFRRDTADFRLGTRQEIKDKMSDVGSDRGNVSYRFGDYLVIHSVAGTSVELDGSYEIVYSNVRTNYGPVSGTLTVSVNESVVLRKVS